jgi:hypothetical protein
LLLADRPTPLVIFLSSPSFGSAQSAVTIGRALRVRIALLVLLTVAGGGCQNNSAPSGASASSPSQTNLRPVALPDLSAASDTVREQIRERYRLLTQQIDDGRTVSADLANAYGEMGKLFMATQYADAAEPCFSVTFIG